MKPADLRPGHRIVCDMPGFEGALTVVGTWNDIDQFADSGLSLDAARVSIDVEVSDGPLIGPARAAQLGAVSSDVLTATPTTMRYRLWFRLDTDVAVEES